MIFNTSLDYARSLDQNDPLRSFRSRFIIPKQEDDSELIYFCGNSLGLQPRQTASFIDQVLQEWGDLAVEGHFMGKRPWIPYPEKLKDVMAEIVGAQSAEIAIMNGLTVNLHLMLASFYQPTKKRFKILMEYNPFPSDRYAVSSFLKLMGQDPKEAIIYLIPDKDELVSNKHIEQVLDTQGDEIALVMLGGVNYYSGQYYDLATITKLGHAAGCRVGFDLAHGAGNVSLDLHNTGCDFAIWCTYKYLNAGPGNLSGVFIHQRHHTADLNRLAGWWGYESSTRFLMKERFHPHPGAEGWVLSNPPVIALAGIDSSLKIIKEAGFHNMVAKSKKMTGYMLAMIDSLNQKRIRVITPDDPKHRGCQLSLQVKDADHSLFDRLRSKGVLGDWREPDIIRVAPVPLYNSFEEIYRFIQILQSCI